MNIVQLSRTIFDSETLFCDSGLGEKTRVEVMSAISLSPIGFEKVKCFTLGVVFNRCCTTFRARKV